MAQIQGDQAAIDNAQTQLSYTTIRSPLTGKAGFRLVDPGNIVHATDTHRHRHDREAAADFRRLHRAGGGRAGDQQGARGRDGAGDALSSDGTKLLSQGHLALVNNAVDQASGDIRMKATFANTDNVLWPGLSVSTRLLLDTLKQVIVVPVDAVERGPNGLYAFVVGNGQQGRDARR